MKKTVVVSLAMALFLSVGVKAARANSSDVRVLAGLLAKGSSRSAIKGRWRAMVRRMPKGKRKAQAGRMVRQILGTARAALRRQVQTRTARVRFLNRKRNLLARKVRLNRRILKVWRKVLRRRKARRLGRWKPRTKLGRSIKKGLGRLSRRSRRSMSGGSVQAEVQKALGIPTKVPPDGCTKPSDLDRMLRKMEEELNTIGDDVRRANYDMQKTLEKQQNALRMMSQISKMLHDTAMAVIRKFGG